ncbi:MULTISPECIES: DUF1697 domain-containing protein [unclassified Streptomyces]|uniref:DUF1697 domain-containing protein n=1 Tax=unclassified Streptomyces TaxID=2593676 RepID=UPI0006F2DBD1|nr:MULTISPECIES: DUF1697 domain-containing protein [unclassified Streptomyces]KQX55760.1 hypothetical protein ASD33_30755 [Streptomyces sp. Root1304]KRA96357.1 hypothetical protein ASE09_27520 [Streptomyces sp. Root66D1]
MTQTYALLLRGINVSGHRKVPMAELRGLLEGLGHTKVRTYLQSGNAVFTTDSDAGEDGLATALEDAIEGHFGFRVDCLVRDGDYLAAVAEACPFPAAEVKGKELHAFYCSGPVTPERFAAIDRGSYLPEDFALGDRVLYLYVPDGLGTSRLAPVISRPSVMKGLVTTARNWNTVLKLIEMTRED